MNCAKSKKSWIDKEATLIHDEDTHYVCNQQTNESNQSMYKTFLLMVPPKKILGTNPIF
jgi:hypothetical protein